MTDQYPFAPVEEAIEAYRRGEMVVIVDDEDRENEGDVCVAAEFVTDDVITFMATEARGLICMTMLPEQCQRLGIDLMVPNNGSPYETAFTVSIEAAEGVSTGISAADRAHTIRVAANPDATAADIIRPGHVFPLKARPNGVLERTGQTEGSMDLARMAGLTPAAAICEIMNDDGTMARVPELAEFCVKHGLLMVSIADMIEYRKRHELHLEEVVTAELPTDAGPFTVQGWRSTVDGSEVVALIAGDVPRGSEDVLVRVHSECLTGDVFHSLRCDCGDQLAAAMREVQDAGQGIIIYLQQEGRGIGLLNKLRAYQLQEGGQDTVEANESLGFAADDRDFHQAAQLLRALGVASVRLLTNNPAKIEQLERYGMPVSERVAIEVEAHEHNRDYLRTKQEKLGHLLQLGERARPAGGAAPAPAPGRPVAHV